MDEDTEKQPREKRERRPLTEVGVMNVMETAFLSLDASARARVALYFASRAGFDIGPLMVAIDTEQRG